MGYLLGPQPPGREPFGIVRVSSTLQLSLSLLRITCLPHPNSSAQALMHCVFPFRDSIVLLRLFLALSFGVTQRTFPGS